MDLTRLLYTGSKHRNHDASVSNNIMKGKVGNIFPNINEQFFKNFFTHVILSFGLFL